MRIQSAAAMQQSHPLASAEEEEDGDGGPSRWEEEEETHSKAHAMAMPSGTSAGMDTARSHPQAEDEDEEEEKEEDFIYPGSSQAPHTTQDQDQAQEQAESSHDAAPADSAPVDAEDEDEEEEEGFHYPGSTSHASHAAGPSRPATAARQMPVPAHFDYARLAQICQSPSSGPGCEPLSALQAFFAQYTSLPPSPSSSPSNSASASPSSPAPPPSKPAPAPVPALALAKTLAEALHPQSGASAVHLAAKSGRADLLAWLLAPAPAPAPALSPSATPSSSSSSSTGYGAGAGADPCVRGAGASKGETPLHKAAWEGHVLCVRVLLLAIGRWSGAREDQSEAGPARRRCR